MVEYRCVNCDILFDWQPTVVGTRVFCCAGCAEGGPCSCDYDNLPRGPEPERPASIPRRRPTRLDRSPRHEVIYPVHGPTEG